MAYIGRLNSIEYSIKTVTKNVWSPSETGWKGTVAYSAGHKTAGKEYDYKTTEITAGDTYGNTPKLIKKVTRVYSAAFTKSNKKYQNYREHTTYTLSGFYSCVDASNVSGEYDPDKYVLYCDGYKEDAVNIMRQPQSVNFNFIDVDTTTVDGKTQISSLDRNTKGHITRKRIRANVVELSVTWQLLTAEETQKILEWASKTQYIRVGFYNPVKGIDEHRAFENNSRSVAVTYHGNFTELTINFIEV